MGTPAAFPLSGPARRQLWARLAIRLFLFVGGLVLIFNLGRPLLSLIMPFLLALLFTWITEPVLSFFQNHGHIARPALTLLLILLVVGALGGALAALIWKGWKELSNLWGNWDHLWMAFQGIYSQLSDTLDHFMEPFPQEARDVVSGLSDRLLSWLHQFADQLVPHTTSAARSISSFVLAFFFFLMAWYFTASDYPRLRRTAMETLPPSLKRLGLQLKAAFSAAFGGYLKAQLLLSLCVMLILMAGFGLLHQPYGILLAVLLAILDFIPILGAGTALVPWAVIDLILGDWNRAFPLLVLWGVIALFRRFMEPKFVGDRTGLHPLLSLLAIYIGMKSGGVLGMILAPVLVLMVRNLWQAGLFRDTVRDTAQAVRDCAALLRTGREPPAEK